MAHVLTLAATPIRFAPAECLRAAIVCGCALALILAGQAIPVLNA